MMWLYLPKAVRCTLPKVADKQYIEKNIIHVAVFKKDDKRTVYNMIYKDGQTGFSYIKRFNVTGITRDKKYELIPQHKESRVLYFTANPLMVKPKW